VFPAATFYAFNTSRAKAFGLKKLALAIARQLAEQPGDVNSLESFLID
jgi:hypothetical protein